MTIEITGTVKTAPDTPKEDRLMDDIARIYDQDGRIITDGLQPRRVCDEAIKSARGYAQERSRRVILQDSDGWWIVGPRGQARRFTARNRRFGWLLRP